MFPEIEDLEEAIFSLLPLRSLINAALVCRRWSIQVWAVRKVLTIDIPFTRLGSLRHFHRLQQLYLPTRTDCRTLSGLEKLTNLTNLVIPFALHVDTLQWPRSLQYVSVEGSDITDKGVNALLTSSPNIESLVLQNCKFAVPNCLPALSQTRCLRKLLIPCEDPAIIGQIVSSTAVEHLYTTCPAGKVVQLFSKPAQLREFMQTIIPVNRVVAVYFESPVIDHFLTPLLLAIKYNASEEVISILLESNDCVNARDAYGRTPFMIAAKHGKILSAPPTQQIDMYATSLNGNNALNWAVLGENGVESVRALISMGFDVNHRNKKKKTPLMQASEMGNVRAVKLLLEAGADPTARDEMGQTALWYATNRNHNDVVTVLVAHKDIGKFINLKSTVHNTTPLFEAIWRNFSDIVRILLNCEQVDVNEPRRSSDDRLHTPLVQSLYNHNVEIATMLLQHPGIDVHSLNSNRSSPLAVATRLKNVPMMKLLLSKGAYPESPSPSHPLLIACSEASNNEYPHTVKVLVDWYAERWQIPSEGGLTYGPLPGQFNPLRDVRSEVNGWTPLHYTAVSSCQALRILLSLPGAAEGVVDIQDKFGHTPLVKAVESDQLEQAEVFLSLGACPNILYRRRPKSELKSLLLSAEERGNTDMAQLLRKYGAVRYPATELN